MSICAIWGAPQSGKTTLAVNLAHAISGSGKSVLLISTADNSELSAVFGTNISDRQCLKAAIEGRESIKHTAHKISELLFILAPSSAAEALDENYSGEQAKTLLTLAKAAYDVVLVDCQSQTSNTLSAWALSKADKILMCAGGRLSNILWYAAHERAIAALERKSIHVSTETAQFFDYAKMHENMGFKPVAALPFIIDAAFLQNEKKLIYNHQGKKGKKYADAIDNLREAITE